MFYNIENLPRFSIFFKLMKKTDNISTHFFNHQNNLINVAEICPATRSLGPGLRSVLWVQGCPFHCDGCIAKDWTQLRDKKLMSVDEVVARLLSNPDITGITFSGGEPMLQAKGLAEIAISAKKQRALNIICFTGYELNHLLNRPPNKGVAELLKTIDVLIDGQYIKELNDNKGLRGSSNQKIHFLTAKLKDFDFEKQIRTNEIQILDGQALLIGVPPKQMLLAFEAAIANLDTFPSRLINYERS